MTIRLARLWLFCLLMNVFVAGAVVAAAAGDSSRSDDQPSAAAAKNVLMIVADDLKACVLGCYGDPICRTPNIDALARRGTVFQRAYCQGTWCRPSRISFMFGRYRDQGNRTLGEHLQTHGLYTARVGKIFHMRVPGDIIAGTDGPDHPECWTERFNAPGLEAHTPGEYSCLNLNVVTRSLVDRQSTRMPHRMFVAVKSDGDGSRQPDFKAASKAIELLQAPREGPFFLAVGLVRPHYPMVAPEAFFDRYPVDQIEMPRNADDAGDDIPRAGWAGTRNNNNPIGKYPENQRRMWSAYYASVSFMDQQVGRILAALEASPHANNTSVIFTSDHGYHLGEHGYWQKSNLHEEVIRVPLVISAPGMQAGRTESIAELVDLYPTICDLTGTPTPKETQGVSLLPILRDSDAKVKSEALSFHNGHSLRTDRWHYIRYQNQTRELYDMRADPQETRNLAQDSEYAETLRTLDQTLEGKLAHLSGRNTQR
ncbi:sulfatase [Roseiconus nitratireducens]|uniref:Sulfatase n=1 Tax=Roseiconus nitratireducens TaxID=2605748 RepID=A0A5M6D7U5_9BACT|nr:sulfatase [Roseiconus nitratireducens]KAA5542560.1 sulfatase [Roseiconus nitratireducens]